MRVRIEHSESQRGMFRKTTYYHVEAHVDLSEEERHVLKQPALLDVVLFELPPPADLGSGPGIEVKIKTILNGAVRHTCTTQSEARGFAEYLKEQLSQVKEFVGAQTVKPKNETYEL